MILFLDTETTGLLPKRTNSISDYLRDSPRALQLSFLVYSNNGKKIIEADCFQKIGTEIVIGQGAFEVHGLDHRYLEAMGIEADEMLTMFCANLYQCNTIAGHNIPFDIEVVACELFRHGFSAAAEYLKNMDQVCTMKAGRDYCQIPGSKVKANKLPSLSELYKFCFGSELEGSHNSLNDIKATAACYQKMLTDGIIF